MRSLARLSQAERHAVGELVITTSFDSAMERLGVSRQTLTALVSPQGFLTRQTVARVRARLAEIAGETVSP